MAPKKADKKPAAKTAKKTTTGDKKKKSKRAKVSLPAARTPALVCSPGLVRPLAQQAGRASPGAAAAVSRRHSSF
jgi:hypothetical protein